MSRLEDRVLLDAVPIDAVVEMDEYDDGEVDGDFDHLDELLHSDHHGPNAATPGPHFAWDIDQLPEALATLPPPITDGVPVEIVFVASELDDVHLLIEDLKSSAVEGRDFAIHYLRLDSDGMEQITTTLSAYSNVDAVHIISHGESGIVQLGETTLSQENLGHYADHLSLWRSSLGTNADILFYGCNLAGSEGGQQLLRSIGELAGADTAASINETGHEAFDGDWDLEFASGTIETAIAISKTAQQVWLSSLATISVTQLADVVNGDTSSVAALTGGGDGGDGISLREAVIAVNNGSGGDTIQLGTGTHLVGLSPGADEATGDFDIQQSVFITGVSPTQTVIDGNFVDRGLHIHSNAAINVSVANLSIQNGRPDVQGEVLGGAIRIDGDGVIQPTVTLSNVWLSSNQANGIASQGGAIFNNGNTTLVNSLIEGNAAELGGGLANGATGILSITNSTITANSATSDGGGGIANSQQLTLQSVTVANNSATSVGGGIFNDDGAGATTSINNTLVADNTASTNSDLDGTYSSDTGDNLVEASGTATGLHPNDVIGVDPALGSLQQNGSELPTLELGLGSAAIDAGSGATAPGTDQRGVDRGALNDIGAFEFTAATSYSTSGESRGSQRSIALDSYGNYVRVWAAEGLDGDGWGVYAQRHDASGVPLTEIQRVNQTTAGDQQWARVVSDDAGNFVVAWTSNQNGNEDVYARRMSANATALSDEFLVNNTTTGVQRDADIDIDPATGRFVVAWEGEGPGDSAGILYRRFDPNGTVLDATDRLANLADRGTEQDPALAMLTGHEFVVGWEVGKQIYFDRFADDGSSYDDELQIDNGVSTSSGLAVDSDSAGNFTFVYREESFLTGVWRRGYSQAGNNNFGWFRVSSSDATSPSISVADDGSFVVAWQESSDSNGTAILGRKFNSDGSPTTNDFQINIDESGNQIHPSIAVVDIDNFHVTWSGDGPAEANGPLTRTFGVGDPLHQLWLATSNDIPASDSPGLASWQSGNILAFADPALAFGSNTSGEFSVAVDFDSFALDGDVTIDGIDVVRRNMAFGTSNPIQLAGGDILFSTADDETFGGISAFKNNIVGFRPSTPGDYSSGSFFLAVNGQTSGVSDVNDFSLIETLTNVGGVDLQPSTLVFNVEGTDDLRSKLVADPISGSPLAGSRLIDVSKINASGNPVHGVEIIETDATLGGVSVTAGALLISLSADGTLGDNSLSMTAHDVALLNVTATDGSTAGDAFMLLEGVDVNLDDPNETVLPIALLTTNAAPLLDTTPNSTLTDIVENDTNSPGDRISSIISDGSITDPDGIAVESIAINGVDQTNGTWEYSLDDGGSWTSVDDGSLGDGHALLLDGTTSGSLSQRLRFVPNPNFFGASSFSFRAWDMTGGGISGDYADTTVTGGSSAFSGDFDSASILVTDVNNNTPVADDESFTVSEGATATEADLVEGLNLLDGDTDFDLPNDTLTVNTIPVTGPVHGLLTLATDGTFTYVHDGSENFTDAFTYEVQDAAGNTDTATVNVTITPVNDNAPVADDESFTIAEGASATAAVLDAGTDYLMATLILIRQTTCSASIQTLSPMSCTER